MIKRKPQEWAKIYHIKLLDSMENILLNEYEWAYKIDELRYTLIPDKYGDFDNASLMELRALELKRDLFMMSDLGEREILEQRYIEIQWLRRNRTFI